MDDPTRRGGREGDVQSRCGWGAGSGGERKRLGAEVLDLRRVPGEKGKTAGDHGRTKTIM